MKPFSKILVPIDFAPHSAEAVRRAVELAGHSNAEIVLAYAYAPVDYPLPEGYMAYPPEQLGRMTEELRRRLEAARKDAEAAGACLVTCRLLQGDAAATIIDLAEEEDFDLIVMGTHGRTGVGRWVMGSVAEKVVRHARCAVLTVKVARDAKE
jgi:nucleotide-binding universal stress UspA family protein